MAVWAPPRGWLRVRLPLERGESGHPQGAGKSKVLCQALLPPAFQEPVWQKCCVLAAGVLALWGVMLWSLGSGCHPASHPGGFDRVQR